MSATYTSVLWNKHKKQYDLAVGVLVISFWSLFAVLQVTLHPEITFETNLIRASGWLALLLLHVILVIGPLARLNPSFNIVLYNRRHLGVTMFLIALIHGGFSTINFHALSDTVAVRSVFVSNLRYDSLMYFPFQTLGFMALLILALMAASSHDFWLKNLGVKTWKGLHMMVYVAYGLLILHVALGGLQNESSPVIYGILLFGFLVVAGLHLVSGFKEVKRDHSIADLGEEFVYACKVEDIENDAAKIVSVAGERVAIFKYENQLSAINNVCKHQGGPLGEGRIIDGCVTCPWHGYQYLPGNGQSPPPFDEKVATYHLELRGDEVFILPNPNAPGTPVEPAKLT